MDGNNVAWGAILINGRSNVSIYNCTFVDFAICGVTYNGASGYTEDPPGIYATGNSFYNNTMSNCAEYEFGTGFGNGGLQIGGQEGMLVHDNVLSQVGRTPGYNGYVIKYYSHGYNKGLKIYNNTITKAPFSGYWWDFDFAVEMWNHRGGVEIYDNTIIGGIDVGGESNVKGAYSYSCWIHNNTIGPITMQAVEEVGVYLERNCSDIIIKNNYFRNLASAVFIIPASTDAVSNIDIIGNIINGIGTTSGSWVGYAIRWTTVDGSDGTIVNNIKINNNVIIGNAENNLAGIMLPDIGTATNITIRNNIIQDFDMAPVYSNTSGTINGLSIENNNFYLNANSNNVLIAGNTPTNYTNLNNKKLNPLFVSASDFHLQAGSPARDAGINVGLPADYEGNPIPFNYISDIGAYEYTSATTTNISTGTITGSPFCAGASVSIPFTVTGTFNSGNIFTAELSNATGSFSAPTVIGSLTGTTSGIIAAIIPVASVQGTSYRIRVKGSNPLTIGSDNGANISINPILAPSISIALSSGNNPSCQGSSVTFSASQVNGGASPSYQWKVNGINAGTNSSAFTTASLTNGQIITCILTSNAPCAIPQVVTSNAITMSVNTLPANAGIISGPTNVYQGQNSVTYTVSVIANASSYIWTLPNGATGSSSTNSINISYSNSAISGYITVKGNNSCGNGGPSTIAVNVNQTPVISNQAFSVAENSANGTNVGTVVASDPDAGQTLTYSILSGNTSGAFAINASTGVLTVANSAALNFEITPSFALVVKVQDNGTGTLSSQATVTVSLTNVNEVPVINNQAFLSC